MNQLKGKNNAHIINQPQIRSTQLETMPSLENNNILSENDEYCYELDKSTYSHVSNTNKSQQSNSNIIQMISELSDYNVNNNEDFDIPLKFTNQLTKNEKNKNNIKNNNIKDKKTNLNKKNNIDINNNLEDNNGLDNSSYNYEMNELNLNNNNEDIDNNIDNEWNVPKITFSEISKVSKANSFEVNEDIMDNDDFDSNNNINNINIIKENLDNKKHLSGKNNENNFEKMARHKKNKESKGLIDDNGKTLNLLNSQYSSVDFLKQTINNCLLKSGYKDVIDNSEKFMAKSSSLDLLNEYSNFNPENEKIKKNLIMQLVLFNNMKNEMEILKRENMDLVRKLNYFKKEQMNQEKKKEEIINENTKRLN